MDLKFNRVVIAGAGSAFWTTVALCREFSKELSMKELTIEVYDDDTFEGGNGFRRLPKVHDPKKFKVEVLRTFISLAMGDPPPIIHTRRLLPYELLIEDWTKTLVIDATDQGEESRKAFWDAIDANRSKGIRLSLDGNGVATVSPGPPLVYRDDNGYGEIPNQGQVFRAAGQGAEAIIFALRTGRIPEFQTFVPTPTNESIEITMDRIMDRHNEVFKALSKGPEEVSN